MYSFDWDTRTGGYRLTTQTARTIASEIRPVFAEELRLTGLDERLSFDTEEVRPFLWAKQNAYLYRGEEIAKLSKTQCGRALSVEWAFDGRKKLLPVNVAAMLEKNRSTMAALVSDTLKRIKEMYDAYAEKCDAVYIGFSGGKDSVALLDLCHKVLPLDVSVVFSDTDMELPDTYKVWEEVQSRYPNRLFIKARANRGALENWKLFGPPSQALRWCCSVHKSTPAILALKKRLGKTSIRTLAFVGVRSEESFRRSEYDDIGVGLKSQSQVNAMPILEWSAHELWLYTLANDLIVNEAYRKGLPRVGCLMCPMSNDRQNELIRLNYPEVVTPFVKAVKENINREFTDEEDANAFVAGGGWYARKSGVSLKDVITEPGVMRKPDRIRCEFPAEADLLVREWLKAVGKINGAVLSLENGVLECVWPDGGKDKTVCKFLAQAVHKAVACVGCSACEAECPTGALRFVNGKVKIDEMQCIHCMRCFAPDEGCWRYYSKRYAGGRTMNISGINKYMTFGLKPEWISILADEQENFRQTTALGNRMIPAAVTWFREAGLIADATAVMPAPLLVLGEKIGFRSPLFWHLIWARLANVSPLVKWFACTVEMGVVVPLHQLDEQLAVSVTSDSVRKGALQSLCQLLKGSPLGDDEDALVALKSKGRAIESLVRVPYEPEPLTTLYGLYAVAEKAGRRTFTVRQLMTKPDVSDEGFADAFISPLVAFGMSPDLFKRQCLGLATQYPDLIACSFALGLDEVRLGDGKTREDVLGKVLG